MHAATSIPILSSPGRGGIVQQIVPTILNTVLQVLVGGFIVQITSNSKVEVVSELPCKVIACGHSNVAPGLYGRILTRLPNAPIGINRGSLQCREALSLAAPGSEPVSNNHDPLAVAPHAVVTSTCAL